MAINLKFLLNELEQTLAVYSLCSCSIRCCFSFKVVSVFVVFSIVGFLVVDLKKTYF